MNSKSPFIKIFVAIICLVILGYGLFRFYPLVVGPQLALENFEGVITTTEQFIDLEIETKRATVLQVQGNNIDISNSGRTPKRIYLSEGINTISLYAEDTYGSSKDLSIFVLKK